MLVSSAPPDPLDCRRGINQNTIQIEQHRTAGQHIERLLNIFLPHCHSEAPVFGDEESLQTATGLKNYDGFFRG